MKSILIVFCALSWTRLVGAEPGLEFSGYVSSPTETRFVIVDLWTGTKSAWLKLGQSFREHKLVAFEAQSEILTVEAGSVTIELHLKDSRIRTGDGRPLPPREIRLGVEAGGDLFLDGARISWRGFTDAVGKHTLGGAPLVFILDDRRNVSAEVKQKALDDLMAGLRKSGAKGFSVRVRGTQP